MLLIIDKRDTILRYDNNSLRIERKEEKPQRIPIKQLQQVIVFGNPMAEVAVWRNLALANVPVAIVSSRGKAYAAMISSGLATQLPFRRLQHRCANHNSCALKQARYFLQLKLKSYALSLHTLQQFYKVENEAFDGFKQQNETTLLKLDQAQSVASLMGLEGQLAHAWFVLLAHSLPFHWKFAGRNRRPPQDPVNALLSLGYTLLSSEIHQLVTASGLDPSLGFLHQDTPGRESLMLDFTEIFRSGVDSFVLQWLAEAELNESSFYFRTKEGCRLSKQTRPLFFKAWAHHRYQWPRPVIETEIKPSETWQQGEIRALVNGHIMQWREYLKETTP